MRIGYGEDSHRLEAGRPLWLGGVLIPASRGALGHSDGDALLHALADAIYSALGLPDIGTHFPPQDPKTLGIASRLILNASLAAALVQDLKPAQVSAVVTLDWPKLSPFRSQLIANLAELLNLEPELIGLSFKTSEGLAPDHIQCRGIVVLV